MVGRWLLVGLLAAGFGTACDRTPARQQSVPPKELRCTAPDCVGLSTMYAAQGLSGHETVGVGAFGSPCRIEAAWPLVDAGGLSVHEVAHVEVGGVFPLRGQVAELDQCQDMMPRPDGHGMFPPMATIGLDGPDLVWAAPAPGNVVIPVRGEASIDGIVVQAVVQPHDAAPSPVADISVGDASWQLVTVRRGLHARDTFPWGAYDATIVRIVAPDTHFVGWVEVNVVPRAARDAATKAARASTSER